jgi:hypothetical protein
MGREKFPRIGNLKIDKFFELEKYLLLFYFDRHKQILNTNIIWCRTSLSILNYKEYSHS